MVSAPLLALLLIEGAAARPAQADEIAAAFDRLYNFDFAGAHAALNRRIARQPQDPLPYAVRSSVYLFVELDRLGILESEFFEDDDRIKDKKKLKPDAGIRTRLFAAINDAESRAGAVLAARPDDHDALFAMCISTGVATDYMALVEKRQLSSLSVAKRSNSFARRLLKADPQFYDAYLTTGVSEYLVGSLPFFVRWFVRFDEVQGSKQKGIENLRIVARSGKYLKPFAKILLGIASLRAKNPREAEKILQELARDFPGNPLFRKELAKISSQLESTP